MPLRVNNIPSQQFYYAPKPWSISNKDLRNIYTRAQSPYICDMIPPKQVRDILNATRIEDVVGDFVTLKHMGANLIGLFPFHGERSPSINVNPARSTGEMTALK